MTEQAPVASGDILHVYLGLATLSVGAGLAWPPAGIMMAGAGLLLIGLAGRALRGRS
jgi:hypothetical protein